jgi:hypothetical protein
MKLMRNLCVVLVLVAAGCDPTAPATTSNQPAGGTTASQQAMSNAMGVQLDTSGPVGGASAPAPAPAPPAPPAAPPTPATEEVKAEAGVGVKGQSLQEHSGIMVEPAKAYFRVEQKMVFNVQIPQAMQLFQATEGRKPNSEQEFMTKIITEQQINLPKLPAGHKYVYNVEKGELMVERPAK